MIDMFPGPLGDIKVDGKGIKSQHDILFSDVIEKAYNMLNSKDEDSDLNSIKPPRAVNAMMEPLLNGVREHPDDAFFYRAEDDVALVSFMNCNPTKRPETISRSKSILTDLEELRNTWERAGMVKDVKTIVNPELTSISFQFVLQNVLYTGYGTDDKKNASLMFSACYPDFNDCVLAKNTAKGGTHLGWVFVRDSWLKEGFEGIKKKIVADGKPLPILWDDGENVIASPEGTMQLDHIVIDHISACILGVERLQGSLPYSVIARRLIVNEISGMLSDIEIAVKCGIESWRDLLKRMYEMIAGISSFREMLAKHRESQLKQEPLQPEQEAIKSI
jgi:hypothetical protein